MACQIAGRLIFFFALLLAVAGAALPENATSCTSEDRINITKQVSHLTDSFCLDQMFS